ncbi:hypothetical protein [Nannocystis pusilla]|uniref:Myxococcus cysteine-rich repeat-containing protein n=1 Tax=Nannocystis pusilla TaxID=889268 RepID=A0ABS7TX63_9BACT|nr:hypothetical protein [Nannocystis pusilla]MBZ5712727.1 hypothetical protein [Nannocystis pusilla]
MVRNPWLVMAMLLGGCSPEPAKGTDSGQTSSDASSDASSTAPTSGGTPDLPESHCGDGVVDPGEACDDASPGCDACTEACTLAVDPELEWSVSLAPIVAVRGFDLTQQQRAWVVGTTSDEAIVLQRIEVDGSTASFDLTALAGFAEIGAFHVNGVTGEAGVLGLLPDMTQKVVRAGADGPIGEPLAIAKGVATELMAITSVGVTFVAGVEGGTATTLAWTGEPLATFASATASFVDAVGDRLVIGTNLVTLVDVDGANRVETMCWGERLATSGTHVMRDASELSWGDAAMESCDLATGERVSEIIATGAGGFEAGPVADVVEAAPNGNPLGAWSVCHGEGSVMGCEVPSTDGFGGPGDPEAIEIDACDRPDTGRLGSDRGVYMIRLDRSTSAPSLVRRGTLPLAPPWG